MLRFNLGRIPVEVHLSHLFFSALLAWTFMPTPGNASGWAGQYLADPSSPGYGARAGAFILLWMIIIFVSILVHELGHALASKAFGYHPNIELVMFGGQTYPNAGEAIPWQRDVLLTLAGPVAGLSLAGVGFIGRLVVASPTGFASYLFTWVMIVNVFWGILNLVPVMPLDGGRIANTLLTRMFGPKGFLAAQIIGLVVAVAAVAYAVVVQAVFLGMLFGLLAVRQLSLVSAYQRGEVDTRPKAHPIDEILEKAAALLNAGRTTEARRLVDTLLEHELPERARVRVYRLLGWIELRDGEGRAALESFQKAGIEKIEPEARAAAHSLAGDDEAALPHWEAAEARVGTGDATILHEWAGALIRLGREDEARALPAVDFARALECAHRVASQRGDHEKAAELTLRTLEEAPTAQNAYDAACAHAKLGQKERAFELIERAAGLGFDDVDYAATDEDLALLHTHGPFVRWVEEGRKKRAP